MRTCLSVLGLALSVTAYAQSTTPAKLTANAVIYVEDSPFGQAMSGAIIKKKVPVVVTTIREKAQFFLTESSQATKEGAAERATKVLALGVFAGSGRTYEASVTVTNSDGAVLFAHNAKKSNIRSAAEDVANKLKEYIKNQR